MMPRYKASALELNFVLAVIVVGRFAQLALMGFAVYVIIFGVP